MVIQVLGVEKFRTLTYDNISSYEVTSQSADGTPTVFLTLNAMPIPQSNGM